MSLASRVPTQFCAAALVLAAAACSHMAEQPACKSDDAGAAAPTTPAFAANAGDVTRFADEEPFGPSAIVSRDKLHVGTAPGGGGTVATLPAGTEVMKLAAHGSDALVCFDDPGPGGKHLMGWVAQSALTDAVAPTPPEEDAAPPPPDPPDPPDPPQPHGHHHRRPKKGRHP